MKDQRKPRLGFVATTMSEFDNVLEATEVRNTEQYTGIISGLLDHCRPFANVVDFGVVGKDAEAAAARAEIARCDCDLLLIWPLNYTLDTVALHLTKNLGLPVLLLNSAPRSTFPPNLDFGIIMENSTVACIPTITNVLLNNGVDFTLLSGTLHDPAVHRQIELHAKAAGAARALRQSRIGVIGHSYPGISALSVDQASVTGKFGVQLVQISTTEIAREYLAVPEAEVERLAARVQSACEIADIQPSEVRDSVRFEPALAKLAEKYQLNAIASLCQEVILHPDMGIAPCHGHTALAEMGVPVTCECDIGTAVAMTILRQFTEDVIFLEYYVQDFDRGLAMCSHCGQGDLRLADGPVTVKAHPCYPARRGRGIAYEYVTRSGDATVACVTPVNGKWIMVAARIECIPHEKLPTSTVQLYFKFKNREFNDAYGQWCELGGIHHFGIAYGDHMEELKATCRYLGVEFRGVA